MKAEEREDKVTQRASVCVCGGGGEGGGQCRSSAMRPCELLLFGSYTAVRACGVKQNAQGVGG